MRAQAGFRTHPGSDWHPVPPLSALLPHVYLCGSLLPPPTPASSFLAGTAKPPSLSSASVPGSVKAQTFSPRERGGEGMGGKAQALGIALHV